VLRVAAHAHGTAGIKAAVRAGVTSIEHGSILDAEAVGLMKDRGTYLVPTLMAGEQVSELARAGRLPSFIAQKALTIAPRMAASFKLALDAGVKIALGTDAGVFPHGRNGHEFTLMVRGGMTPMQSPRRCSASKAKPARSLPARGPTSWRSAAIRSPTSRCSSASTSS
jgi:imidazolonepropionase-like amidohydrolase